MTSQNKDDLDYELINHFTEILKPLNENGIERIFELIATLGEGLPKDAQLMDSPNWAKLTEEDRIFAHETLMKLSPHTKVLRDLTMTRQMKIMLAVQAAITNFQRRIMDD